MSPERAGPRSGHGPKASENYNDQPPPFWGSWGRIYLVVALALAVETLVFFVLGAWAA